MMKQIFLIINLLFICNALFARQSDSGKNFLDVHYLETSVIVDTLVTPDEIYLSVILSEQDTKDRVSIEELEQKMIYALTELGLKTSEVLKVNDITSAFDSKILRADDIIKTKSYTLRLSNATMLARVFTRLEKENISNVSISELAYSKDDEIMLALRNKAILRAKAQAVALTEPIGQKVGRLLYVLDEGNSRNFPQVATRNTLNFAPGAAKKVLLKSADSFKKLKFSINLTARFEIKE